MTTLYDIFQYNNIPYSELTDEDGKREVEHWISELKSTDIEKQILKDFPNSLINIRTFGMLEGDQRYVHSLPDDLFFKVCQLVYPTK